MFWHRVFVCLYVSDKSGMIVWLGPSPSHSVGHTKMYDAFSAFEEAGIETLRLSLDK